MGSGPLRQNFEASFDDVHLRSGGVRHPFDGGIGIKFDKMTLKSSDRLRPMLTRCYTY